MGRRIWVEEGEEELARTHGLEDEDIALCALLVLNPRYIFILRQPDVFTKNFYSSLKRVFEQRVILLKDSD